MNLSKISKSKTEIICPSKSILNISTNYQPEILNQLFIKDPSLINNKDQKNETFLSYAIKRKNEEISKLIITLPLLDLSYKDSKGNSYLHLAVINGLINIIELLIKKGININSQNNEGNTPLHYAYNINNIKIISILIGNHAELNIKNNNGLIPENIELNSLNDNINDSFNDFYYKSYYNNIDKNISTKMNNKNAYNIENTNNTKLTETNKNSFKYSVVNFSYSEDEDDNDKKEEKKDELNILDIQNTDSEVSDIFNLTSSITYKKKMKDVLNINSHTIGEHFNLNIKNDDYQNKSNNSNLDDIVNLQNSKKEINNNNSNQNIKNNNICKSKSDNVFFEYSTSVSKEDKDLQVQKPSIDYNKNKYNKSTEENINIKSSYKNYIDQDFIFSPFATIKESPNEQNNLDEINITNNNPINIPINLKDDSLYKFLSEINLEKKYYNLMNSNGFENFQFLIEQEKTCIAITDSELKEIGILLPGDRAKILIHLEEKAGYYSFPIPKNVYYQCNDINNIIEDGNIKKIYNWLKNIKVENYLENWIEGGYYSIELMLMQMNSKHPINDFIMKDELGIIKVGHRARIINKLVEDGKKFWNKLKDSVTIIGNKQLDKNCECIIF